LCDLLGDGVGLGVLLRERDGDGLGERDLDGLLLGLGLGLLEGLLLGLLEGLFDGLVLGLFEGLLDGLGLALFEEISASSRAVTVEAEPRPHGEALGLAAEANAGAIAKPEARKDPATTLMATRTARVLATGTGALRSSAQPASAHAAVVAPCQPT
jgi:predicted lipid-binding transport protein (Tim44 family)